MATSNTVTEERIRSFKFERFYNESEEWKYYIQRFEMELSIFGWDSSEETEPIRRKLLLSKIGPEPFKIVVDHVHPEPISSITYINIKEVLTSFYEKNI